jgi:hypothetical protein
MEIKMINKPAEIILVDDEQKEAKPLQDIFSKQGIGSCYFEGSDITKLPENPIIGVRCLFLDFVLANDGQNDTTKVSTLIKVVKTIVSFNNGPYIIIAWTKHEHLIALFKSAIMNDTSFPKPTVIINLEKTDCLGKSFLYLKRKINRKLKNLTILEILFDWENNASSSIRDVLFLLSEISLPQITSGMTFEQYSDKWNLELEKHFCQIGKMMMGENIVPNKKLIIAIQSALSEPFRDCLEKRIDKQKTKFSKSTAKIYRQKDINYTENERAVMNTLFLIISRDLHKEIKPGNIYSLKKIYRDTKCKLKDCYLNKSHVTQAGIISSFFNGKKEDFDKFLKKKEILSKAIPLAIEISPECDFSQKKWKHARLLTGVLWPSDFRSNLKKADFLFKPLSIIYKDKSYLLSFNAHYTASLTFQILEKINPMLMARKELIVDIQHWFSNQMSRPGKNEF